MIDYFGFVTQDKHTVSFTGMCTPHAGFAVFDGEFDDGPAISSDNHFVRTQDGNLNLVGRGRCRVGKNTVRTGCSQLQRSSFMMMSGLERTFFKPALEIPVIVRTIYGSKDHQLPGHGSVDQHVWWLLR